MTSSIDVDSPVRKPRIPNHTTLIQGIALLWAIAILVVCWTPRQALPVDETSKQIGQYDKLVHASIFAVLGLLAMAGQTNGRRIVQVVLIGIALAAVSEIGQALPIIGRDGEWGDGLADTMGLLVGVGVSLGLVTVWKRLFGAS